MSTGAGTPATSRKVWAKSRFWTKASDFVPALILFGQAINKVNDVQQASSRAAQGYIKGDPNIDISQVMIASQKSSVAFQAATQVRNKLVEAYKDVMNMPI